MDGSRTRGGDVMMKLDDEDDLVARASAPVRAQVTELHDEAPAELRPVLAHVRDHALETGYSVKVLKRELRIRGNELMVEVTRWVGLPPWRLIAEVRMATTAELLRTTELEVDTIASRVGYTEAKSLRRAFQAWCGMSPTEFRRRARRAHALAGPPPAGMLSLLFWRRLYAGKVRTEVVAQVLEYYERLMAPHAEVDADGDDGFLPALASELADMLEPWPWPEQLEAVRQAIRWSTPMFSDLLHERSVEAARRGDLARSAELAELSLAAVEATEEMVGAPDPERRGNPPSVPPFSKGGG
jgi:AraC-like DNA-binding protein